MLLPEELTLKFPLKRYLVLLETYLKPQWQRASLLALLLVISIGLQLTNPFILKFFIDTAIAQGISPSLVVAGVAFMLIALLNQGISVLDTYLSEQIAWTATNQLRIDLMAHCISLDMSFHKMRTAGELIERLDGDVDALSNFFSQFIVSLLTNTLLLLGMLVVFYTINWHVGLIMTLFCMLVFIILMHLRRRSLPFFVTMRQISADFFGFLSEHLQGTEDLRANGATNYVMYHFYTLLQSWFPLHRKTLLARLMIINLSLFFFICGSVLILSLGAYLWSIKAITVGTVYLMFSITDKLSSPLYQIQTQLQDLQQAEACIQRIEQLLQTSSTLHEEGNATLPDGPLSLSFQNVSFAYSDDTPVLHDLSFSLPAGKVLGLLGHTGSGKSTLARLIFRLYDPQQGEIYLGENSLRTMKLRELRRHIGLVTQDVQLFQASVRDNLTFFQREISDTHILATLQEVGLAHWYQTLPEGLDTMLGPAGAGLSAGEAQLLAFARVFLSNPGLVILDEASSRLDPATERAIEQAIDTLLQDRTAIVIAHRLSTIQRVNDILILQDGQIHEYGDRIALANNPTSQFAQLLKTGIETERSSQFA